MVVGELVVVEALLTILLRRFDFGYISRVDKLVQQALLVRGVQTDPASLVRALRFDFFHVGEDGDTVTSEALFTYVRAPSDRVALIDGVLHGAHEFIDGKVVGLSPTPVVFDFEGELAIEGVMSEGGQ